MYHIVSNVLDCLVLYGIVAYRRVFSAVCCTVPSCVVSYCDMSCYIVMQYIVKYCMLLLRTALSCVRCIVLCRMKPYDIVPYPV